MDPTNASIKMFDIDGTGTGTVAELEQSSLLQAIFAPDVQMFDATGVYHPNAANTTPDCLSFGIGFTAVKPTSNRQWQDVCGTRRAGRGDARAQSQRSVMVQPSCR